MQTEAAVSQPENTPKMAPEVQLLKATPPGPDKTRPPRTKLHDHVSVKRWMCWVIERLAEGDMQPQRANALILALNSLSGIISDVELARQVEELERRMRL